MEYDEQDIKEIKESLDEINKNLVSLFSITNIININLMSMSFLLQWLMEKKFDIKPEEYTEMLQKKLNDIMLKATLYSINGKIQ